ncbi:MAG TPA: FMN-binding protein [Candidatus Limnocylindria bacterium]
MRRALTAFAATVIGVYWLVTFKVTAEPIDVPVVTVPSPRVTTAPGQRTPQPTARTTTPATTGGVSGGTAFTGPTVETLFGPVQVQIALSGGKILDVQALQLPSDRSRSARISQYSAPILRSEAIQAQSARVDVVSGATYTSRAYAQSLASALKQAGQ